MVRTTASAVPKQDIHLGADPSRRSHHVIFHVKVKFSVIKYLKKIRISKLPRFTSNIINLWQLILENQKKLNI